MQLDFCRYHRAVRQRDGDAALTLCQREDAIVGAKVPDQSTQCGMIGLDRDRPNLGCQGFELELRIGPGEIGKQSWPLRRRRGREKSRSEPKLMLTVDREGIVTVGPADQEDRGDDQMQRDDRSHHQRRDLSADPLQLEKARQHHGQLAPDATARTVGVNR